MGLASRAEFAPALIKAYLGDMLYAVMIYLIIGFTFPRLSSGRVALISILLCYSIEVSQLYQADWIVALRQTRLGGLVLGFGFLWSDLLSYTVGGMMGVGLEWLLQKKGLRTAARLGD